MSKTTTQALVSAAANTAGMGAALTSTGAAYVITASGAADLLGHKIIVTNNSATNHSGKTLALVGTNENGEPVTETLAHAAGSTTTTSAKYYKTLTSITPSASTGVDTFDIGWTAAAVGPRVYPDLDVSSVSIGISVSKVAGSPNFSIRYTYDFVDWYTHATITGKTASFDGTITIPCRAFQVILTVDGSVTMTAIQAGRI